MTGDPVRDEHPIDEPDHPDEPGTDRPDDTRRPPGDGSVFAGWGTARTATMLALAAIAMLLVGFLVGFGVRGSEKRTPSSLVSAVPSIDSVEAGFARDMIAHHEQGVTMAHFAELHSDDPEVQLMAYDIMATQQAQIGMMRGWLSLWQLPEQVVGPRMAWMSSGGHHMAGMGPASATPGSPPATTSAPGTAGTATAGRPGDGPTDSTGAAKTINTADDSGHMALMPGMATSGEMERLQALRGKESDVYFLQLMIRHHQGGAPMMSYTLDHAANPVVANAADKMLQTQTSEISVMTQMLEARGAQPLPFDTGN